MENQKLQQLLTNHQIKEDYPILKDFSTYLEFIAKNKILFEPESMNMARHELKLINLKMSPPEKSKDILGTESFPRLKLFYILALILELIDINQDLTFFLNMNRVKDFSGLSPIEQYSLLLDIFWQKVPWNCWDNQDNDWQEKYSYLTALICCPVGKEVILDESKSNVLVGKRLKKLLPQGGPFLSLGLPNLRHFGLIEYSLAQYGQEFYLKSILVTSLGGDVFPHLYEELMNNPKYLLGEAWERLEKDQIQEARKITENVLQQVKNYPEAYNLLGATYLEEEDYEQALYYYRQARDKSQRWMGLNFRESFLFQPQEKKDAFLKALLGLALAYRGQENWLMAVEILHDILDLDPQDCFGVRFFLKDIEKKAIDY